MSPDRPEPQFASAFYLTRLGYPASVAIGPLRRAFERDPSNLVYRCGLAFLLAEDRQVEEAYDLLRDVPVSRLGCACQLRRTMSVFQANGDFVRWQQCHDQLQQLQDDHE